MSDQGPTDTATAPTTETSNEAETYPVETLPDDFEFVAPTKYIKTAEDVVAWEKSEAYARMMDLVLACNDAIQQKSVADECPTSEGLLKVVAMLEEVGSWIDEIPPVEQPMRFGNKAFRTWYDRLRDNVNELHTPFVPEKFSGAVVELAPYLEDCFGNYQRIDYGTGHEAAFMMWLTACWRLGVFAPDDLQALVTRVFVAYLGVCRKLQLTYLLEPAGSHGVWGLDDYQFLPFLWGAGQLVDHDHIKPKSILNADIIELYAQDYLYLDSVKMVSAFKTGPFQEHSPMLNDIAGVVSWRKINGGMVKMWVAEVLKKRPCVQHFWFGNLLPFTELAPAPADEAATATE